LLTAFDNIRARTSRLITRIGPYGPLAAQVLPTRFPELYGIVARERLRLYLTLVTSPYASTALAPRLVALLQARRYNAESEPSPSTSWVHLSLRAFTTDAAAYGVPNPLPLSPSFPADSVSRLASAYGRAIGLAFFQKRALALARATTSKTAPLSHLLTSVAPRQSPPTAHILDTHAGLSQDVNSLGDFRGFTPLSRLGPGCSGSTFSLVPTTEASSYLPFIAALRLGRTGLFLQACTPPTCLSFPEALRTARPRGAPRRKQKKPKPAPRAKPQHEHEEPREPTDEESLIHNWHRAASGAAPLPCPLCDSPSSPLGPFHVLLVCPHPATSAARAAAVPLLLSLLTRIYSELYVVRERTRQGHWRPAPPAALVAAQARATEVRERCSSWSDADRDFTLYRLLLALPWGATAVPGGSSPVSSSLGAAFDATAAPHHLLHPIINRWVLTAGRLGSSIVSAWSAGVQLAWDAAGGAPDTGAALGHYPIPPRAPEAFSCRPRGVPPSTPLAVPPPPPGRLTAQFVEFVRLARGLPRLLLPPGTLSPISSALSSPAGRRARPSTPGRPLALASPITTPAARR
jgi:hypothetical protein